MEDLVASIDALDIGEEQRAVLIEKARASYSRDGRKKIRIRSYAGPEWSKSGRWTLSVDTGEGYDGHHEMELAEFEGETERPGVARFRARLESPLGVALAHRRLEFTVKRDGKTVYREDQTRMWLSVREYPFRVIKVGHADGAKVELSNIAFELRRRCGAAFWTMDELSVELCYSDACEEGGGGGGSEYVDAMNWNRKVKAYEIDEQLALLTFEADDEQEHLKFFADNLPIFHTLLEPPHTCERRWRLYAAAAAQMVRFSEETRAVDDPSYRHSAWRRLYSPELALDASLVKDMRAGSFLPEECSEAFYGAVIDYHASEASGAFERELDRIANHARLVKKCLAPRVRDLKPWCVVWDRKRRAPWTPATYDTEGTAALELCVFNTAHALVWLDEHRDSIPPINVDACSYFTAVVAGESVLGRCIFADSERMVLDVFRVDERYCAPSAPIELPIGYAAEVQATFTNPGTEIREALEAYLEHCHHPDAHEPALETRTRFLETASFYAKSEPNALAPVPDTKQPNEASAGALAYDVEGKKWYMFMQTEKESAADLLDLYTLEPASSARINDRLWVADRVPRKNWLDLKNKVLDAAGPRVSQVDGSVLRDLRARKPDPMFVFQNGTTLPRPLFKHDEDGAAWLAANDLSPKMHNVVRMYRFRDARFRMHEGLAAVQSVDERTGAVTYRLFTHNGAWVYGSPKPLTLDGSQRARMWFARLPGPLTKLDFGPSEVRAAPVYFVAVEPDDSMPYAALLGPRRETTFDTLGGVKEVDFRRKLSYSRSGSAQPIPSDNEDPTFELRGLPTKNLPPLASAALNESAGSFADPSVDLWDALRSLDDQKADGAFNQAAALVALLLDRAFLYSGNSCRRVSPKSKATVVSGKVALKLFDNHGRPIVSEPKRFISDPAEITALRYENGAGTTATLDAETGEDLAGMPLGLYYDTVPINAKSGYQICLDSGRKVLEAQRVTTRDERVTLLRPFALRKDGPPVPYDLFVYVHPFDQLRSDPVSLPDEVEDPGIPKPNGDFALDKFRVYKIDDFSFYGVRLSESFCRIFCYAREGLLPEPFIAYVPNDKTGDAPADMTAALKALHELYHGKFATHQLHGLRTCRSRWHEWISQGFETASHEPPPAPAPKPTAPVAGEFYLSNGETWLATSPGKGFRMADREGRWSRDRIPETAAAPKTASLEPASVIIPTSDDKNIYLYVDDADPRLAVYDASSPLENRPPSAVYKQAMKKGATFCAYPYTATGNERLFDALASASPKQIEIRKPRNLGEAFLFTVHRPDYSKVPLVSSRSSLQPALYYKSPETDRVWALYREKSDDHAMRGRYVGGKTLSEEESRRLLARNTEVVDFARVEFQADGFVLGMRSGRLPPVFATGKMERGVVSGEFEVQDAADLGTWTEPRIMRLSLFDLFISAPMFSAYSRVDAETDLVQLRRRILVSIAGEKFKLTYFTVQPGDELGYVRKSTVGGEPEIGFVSERPGPSLSQLTKVDVVTDRREGVSVDGERTFVEPGETVMTVLGRVRAKPAPPPGPLPSPAPPPVAEPKEEPIAYSWIKTGRGEYPRTLLLGPVPLWEEEREGALPKFYHGPRDKGIKYAIEADPISLKELRKRYPSEFYFDVGSPRTQALVLPQSMHYVKSASATLDANGKFRFRLQLEGHFPRKYDSAAVAFGVYRYAGSIAAPADLDEAMVEAAIRNGSAMFVRDTLAYDRARLVLEADLRFVWRESTGDRRLLYGGQMLLQDGHSEAEASSDLSAFWAFVPNLKEPIKKDDREEEKYLAHAKVQLEEFRHRFPKDAIVQYGAEEFGFPAEIAADGGLHVSAREIGLEERPVPPVIALDFEAKLRFTPAAQLSGKDLAALFRALGKKSIRTALTVFDPSNRRLARWERGAPSLELQFVSTDQAEVSDLRPLDAVTALRLRNFGADDYESVRRCVNRSLVMLTDDDELEINLDGTFGAKGIPIARLWSTFRPASVPSPVLPDPDRLKDALRRYIEKRRTMAVVRLKKGGRIALGNLDDAAANAQILYRSTSPWTSAGYQGSWWRIDSELVAAREHSDLDVAPISETDLRDIMRDVVANRASPFVSSSGKEYHLAYTAQRIGAAEADPYELLYVISRADYHKSQNAAACTDTLDAALATVTKATRRAAIEPRVVSLRELAFVVRGIQSPRVKALLDAVERRAAFADDVPLPEQLQAAAAAADVPEPEPAPPPPPPQPAPAAAAIEPYNAHATRYIRGPLQLPSVYASTKGAFSIKIVLPSYGREISFARHQRFGGPGSLYVSTEPAGDARIYFPSGPVVVVLNAPKLGVRRLKLFYNMSPEIFGDPSYTQVQMTFASHDLLPNRDYASRILFERDGKSRIWRIAAAVVSARAIYQ